MPTRSARLVVGAKTLHLQQWSGSTVGSGGNVWGASRRLSQYLEAYGDGSPPTASAVEVLSRPLSTLRLLDVGSGTGAVGLAAALLGFGHVTLSEQASFCYPNSGGPDGRKTPVRSLLDLARANVQRNVGALQSCDASDGSDAGNGCDGGGGNGGNGDGGGGDSGGTLPSGSPRPRGVARPLPEVARLLWGDEDDLAAMPHTSYDVICGGDILLFTGFVPQLLQTLQRLSSATTVVLIEHTDRGNSATEFPLDLMRFLEAVHAEGMWQPTVVRDVGRHITLRMTKRPGHTSTSA